MIRLAGEDGRPTPKIFRDSQLAARGLWPQLEAAIEGSSAFLLVLSQRAASSSEGVSRELDHWTDLVTGRAEHGNSLEPRERTTYVAFTDLPWRWAESRGGFVAGELPAPRALAELFPEEPKAVDLTWVRRRRQLRPGSLRFTESLVPLAAELSGLPVERLLGEARRERRKRRYRAVGLLLVIVMLLGGMQYYWRGRFTSGQAERFRDGLVEESQNAMPNDPRLAALLAAEAWRRGQTTGTSENLMDILSRTPYRGALTGQHSATNAVAAVRDLVAVGSYDHTIALWRVSDGTSRTLLDTWSVPGLHVLSVAFSPDGRLLAAGTDGGRLLLWDIAVPDRRTSLGTVMTGGGLPMWGLAFGPSGALYSAGQDGVLRVWRAEPGRRLDLQGSAPVGVGPILDLAVDPASPRVAVASGKARIALLETVYRRTPKVTRKWRAHDSRVYAVAFDPTGGRLVSGADDGRAVVWDLKTPRTPPRALHVYGPRGGSVLAVAYSGDGGRLLIAGAVDPPVLYSVDRDGRPVESPDRGPAGTTLPGGAAEVYAGAFSGDGGLVFGGGADYTVRIWSTRSAGVDRRTLMKARDGVNAVATDPGSGRVAVAVDDGSVLLGTGPPGRRRKWTSIAVPSGGVAATAVALSPRGDGLTVGLGDGRVLRCRYGGADPCEPLPGAAGSEIVQSVSYDLLGGLVAAAKGSTIWVWNTGGGAPRAVPSGSGTVRALAPAGEDGLAAATAGSRVVSWRPDGRGPGRRRELLSGSVGYTSLSAAPDGRLLVAGDDGGGVASVSLDGDGAARRADTVKVAKNAIVAVAMVGIVGHAVATAGDGSTWILHVSPGGPYRLAPVPPVVGGLRTLAPGPEPASVVGGGAAGSLLSWDVTGTLRADTDPIAHVCAIAGRGLDADEQTRHLRDEDPQVAC